MSGIKDIPDPEKECERVNAKRIVCPVCKRAEEGGGLLIDITVEIGINWTRHSFKADFCPACGRRLK